MCAVYDTGYLHAHYMMTTSRRVSYDTGYLHAQHMMTASRRVPYDTGYLLVQYRQWRQNRLNVILGTVRWCQSTSNTV